MERFKFKQVSLPQLPQSSGQNTLQWKKYSQIVKVEKIHNTMCWQGSWVAGTLIHCWWLYGITNHLENSLTLFSKCKYFLKLNNLLYKSNRHIPKSGYIPKRNEDIYQPKDKWNYIHRSINHSSSKLNTLPNIHQTGEWIKKCVYYLYTGDYTNMLQHG